jgi:hypothetical protein
MVGSGQEGAATSWGGPEGNRPVLVAWCVVAGQQISEWNSRIWR